MTATQLFTQIGITTMIVGAVAWYGRLFMLAILDREREKTKQINEAYRLVLTDEYKTYRKLWEDLSSIYGNFHNLVDNHIGESQREKIQEDTLMLCNDMITFLLRSKPFIDDDIFRLSSRFCDKVRSNLNAMKFEVKDCSGFKSHRDRLYGDFEAICYRMKGRVHDVRDNAKRALDNKRQQTNL